ncbi:beta-N-acetylhexosaminidase [Pseudoxanthobacter sp.]|uniref:beta-N-acetylhexosaminidase n=1 Tax=Pseudoxanthobacter sp. TaxID=1925742 RepID=UPI002FE07CA0
MTRAFITGLAGPELLPQEADFLAGADPWGLILFRRNCRDRAQVRALTDAFRAAVGRADAPVLVDQEGGRVQRLRPPVWRAYPPAAAFGRLYAADAAAGLEAAELVTRLMAEELLEAGITVDCLPVLDVPVPGVHDVIGDRAYAAAPEAIVALASAAVRGLMAGGVLPVMKHMPGHGRSTVDSHLSLPVVTASRAALEAGDFVPFRALAGLPLAMTAHIVFTAIDPDRPATQSPVVIGDIVRGALGFSGALMSDDLSMQALEGDLGTRAARAFAAGCDLALHCNGNLAEMEAVAAASPVLAGAAAARCARALAARGAAQPFDRARALALLAALETNAVA